MKILAIDPGNTESAYVVFDTQTQRMLHIGKVKNDVMLATVRALAFDGADVIVLEQIASYGMAVGETVFETVFWTGRFVQRWLGVRKSGEAQSWYRLKRMEVKMHLCHNSRAKDGNIRQALIDRFGEVGTKKHPGTLYGVSGDVWAALAVAVTWADTRSK